MSIDTGHQLTIAPIIVSAEFEPILAGRRLHSFAAWRKNLTVVFESPQPIGFLLSQSDKALIPNEILQQLSELGIPIIVPDGTDQVLSSIFALYDSRHLSSLKAIHELRAGNAAVRIQHERTQSNFAATEDWLAAMLAPKFVKIRHLLASDDRVAFVEGDRFCQMLPISSFGLAAIDLDMQLDEGANLSARLLRSNGEILAEFIVQAAPAIDRSHRLILQSAIDGPPEDVWLEVKCTAGAGRILLARPVPIPDLFARLNGEALRQSLALSLWCSLPGTQLPPLDNEQGGDAGWGFVSHGEGASPTALRGHVTVFAGQGMVELRPDPKGNGLAVFQDVKFGDVAQIEAFLQMLGDDGATVTFEAVPGGIISNASDAYRLKTGSFIAITDYTRLAATVPAGTVDVVLRIENAHPGAALRLWALKVLRKP